MEILKIITKLTANGYSLSLIAKQSGISYMDLYRSYNQHRPLTAEEEAAIRRFALVQPCMGI